MSAPSPAPTRHHAWRIAKRTLAKSWDDSIFSESAQAGFWSVLSLPPLLLGLLGSLAYVAPLFGPDALPTIQDQLISTANSFFSANIVAEIIEPTIADIVQGARGEVVSLGFVISLWAGSSAISAYVDSVVEAHGQMCFCFCSRAKRDVEMSAELRVGTESTSLRDVGADRLRRPAELRDQSRICGRGLTSGGFVDAGGEIVRALPDFEITM